MKVAVIGSRTICIDHLEWYIPSTVTEIISGGAKGVDTCAKELRPRTWNETKRISS